MRRGLRFLAFGGLACLAASPQWRPAQIWEKVLAPGLTYRQEVDPNLPRVLNAIRLTPDSPSLRWSTELAGKTVNEDGTVKGRLTPTLIGVQSGALAVVNGDFFSYEQGAPVGMLVRNGELLTSPLKPRAVFGWGPKVAATGMASVSADVNLGNGDPIAIDAINQPVGESGVVLYTPAEGTALLRKPNITVVLDIPDAPISPSTTLKAKLESITPNADRVTVTKGHALLVATGGRMSDLSDVRDNLTIRIKSETFDWERFENVIGGGPFLLRGGEAAIDAQAEGFKDDFLVRHPRTAIGKTAQGDVWIVTVDGRQASSVGATLEDMARIMKRLGCTDAINLDGGGSSALNLFGLTVNRPADGVERPVSSGIIIFGPKPPEPAGKLKIVSARSAEGLSVHVELDGRRLPDSEVLWTSRGSAWVDQGGIVHPIHGGKAKILARVHGEPLEYVLNVDGAKPADPKKVPAADRGL